MSWRQKFKAPEENFQFEQRTDWEIDKVITGLGNDIFISLKENDASDICSIPEELQDEFVWHESDYFPDENDK